VPDRSAIPRYGMSLPAAPDPADAPVAEHRSAWLGTAYPQTTCRRRHCGANPGLASFAIAEIGTLSLTLRAWNSRAMCRRSPDRLDQNGLAPDRESGGASSEAALPPSKRISSSRRSARGSLRPLHPKIDHVPEADPRQSAPSRAAARHESERPPSGRSSHRWPNATLDTTPDGTDYPNRIVYREIVKPERLVYDHDDGDGKHTLSTAR
jgi:Activator of Hsp90 ATPase homolog 1-like protein